MSDLTLTLRPCPFCGGRNIETDCFNAAFGVPAAAEDCFAYCKDCDAQGPPAATAELAHARWNTRGAAQSPAIQWVPDAGPLPGAAA